MESDRKGLRGVDTLALIGPTGRNLLEREGPWGSCRRGVPLAALLLLVTSAGAAAGPVPCKLLVPFDPANFTDPTLINNKYLPRVPGTEMVLEKDDGGLIVTRVTAQTKTIKFGSDEVTTRVIWELDIEDDGETVAEEELRFEAQDKMGNVWNFGELPLENDPEDGPTFQNTWIAGFDDALAGIAMLAAPDQKKTHKNKWYLQAFAPDVIGDCGKVTKSDVPVEDPENPSGPPLSCVLIRESSTAFDGEGGVQLKTYCPEEFVGLEFIDGQGGPDGQEMAELISITGCEDRNPPGGWRDAVEDLEAMGYAGVGDEGPPAPYEAPNVAVCQAGNPAADCPNHEPVDGPDVCQ